MTPWRLAALVKTATGRRPSDSDLIVWGDALACRGRLECPAADCVHDDEGDQALKQHFASSTYPPTPADVRRIAIGLANLRVEQTERLEREQANAERVPPTAAYLAARAEFERRQAERARDLDQATDTVGSTP